MEYYVLYNPRFLNRTFAFGEEKGEFNTGQAKICGGCGNFISMLEWLPPYDIKVSKENLGDLIFGTFVGFCLSERFKIKYEQSDLKGLSNLREGHLYFKNKSLHKEYYYPDIALINAFVDMNLIEFEDWIPCETCQRGNSIINKINGVYFTDESQVAEDIFFSISLGQATIIVSQKFKNFVEENNFTNAKFIELNHYQWDSMKPMTR